MQRSGQIQRLLEDRDEHIDRHSDPDLGFDDVLRSAEEVFVTQMLLDPFKEPLNLPAEAIQLADGGGVQFEVVGQEHEGVALFVLAADAAQRRRIVLGGVEPGEHAEPVADDADGSIAGPGVATLEAQLSRPSL